VYRSLYAYFFSYIFKAKTRQRLLFLALVGLFLSTFALIVLQSTMGGLQHKLIYRAKRVEGHASVILKNQSESFSKEVLSYLKELGHTGIPEYEIELLLKVGSFLSPVMIHAIDPDSRPNFLPAVSLKDMILPYDLALKLDIGEGEEVRLISPSHVDAMLGDVPRAATVLVEKTIATDVPEIDSYHAWVRLGVIQNLMRKRLVNKIRLYRDANFAGLAKTLKTKFSDDVLIETWEQKNKTLVWALGLETTVMVFLFIAMTFLVSLCITSGLLIFFDKVKGDLASFWIMGASKEQLMKAAGRFLASVSLGAVLLGLLCGLVFLGLLDRYGWEIMPNVFVDRKIPIYITLKGILVSLCVPFSISILFCAFSLAQFKRETNYLDHVRSIG
jgi:lipoprotein-releasing system permease protein